MEVKEAILHRLIKEKGQTEIATVDPRSERLPVNDVLVKLTGDLIKIYNRTSNGIGTFHSDEQLHRFPKLARDYVADRLDFVDFSVTTANLIVERMKSAVFASGGYLLLVRYSIGEHDQLIAAMLKLRPGTGVDEKTKELIESVALDVEHVHEAARINIPRWLADEQPYLSFVKKKAGKDDVTRYFRTALGCTDYTDSKYHTKKAMEAIDSYMDAMGWDTDKKISVKSEVYRYLSLKNENKEHVNLKSLSSIVHDQEPEGFEEYVKENDYNISDNFEPHPSTYKRYKRLSGKIGTINLTLDVDDVIQGRIRYDEGLKSIIISGPENSKIVEDIREYQDGNSD